MQVQFRLISLLSGSRAGEANATVEIVEDVQGLRRLRGAWEALAARRPSPMQQFGWALAAAESFAASGELRVFLCHGEGRLRAAAALAARESPAGPCLEALGVGELYEPTDFPADDGPARLAIARAIAATAMPLCLERLPADSSWIAALRAAYRGRALIRVAPAHASPFVELEAGLDTPEGRLNPGRRSDLRRALRRAREMGPLEQEVIAPRTPEQAASALAEAFAVEAACWKGEQGSALACDTVRGRFFQRYAAEAAEAGILRLCFLRIGGVAAAMQIAVEVGRRFWLLKIGYDARFASCSPGAILMAHAIGHAARRGLEAFEFLGCPEAWTRPWGACEHACVALRAYPFNARGAAAFGHHLNRALSRRIGRLAREDRR